MGWLGPQLVRYGHNNAAALRQVPDLINNAKRPVPLMWNHSDDIHDKAGKVLNAAWEESSDIPPGVNGDLVVQRQYDPKAAVGLETGELDATSLCVLMDKERSHPDMDFWTFVELAAGPEPHEVDGQIVAWLPISVTRVYHHALVWSGADGDSGPRAEQSTANQAASAVRNSKPEGGTSMETVAVPVAALQAMCAAHGFDVALAAGGELPKGLVERLTDKAKALNELQPKYNHLAEGLQKWQGKVLQEGEATLNAAQVLERLPEVFENADHGKAYIEDLRQQAVTAFDKAEVDPTNPQSLTDVQKRQRERLSNGTDRQQLKDAIVVNTAKAKERFGPNAPLRSSAGEELPPATGNTGGSAGGTPMTAEERRIAASFDSTYGRRSE